MPLLAEETGEDSTVEWITATVGRVCALRLRAGAGYVNKLQAGALAVPRIGRDVVVHSRVDHFVFEVLAHLLRPQGVRYLITQTRSASEIRLRGWSVLV